MTRLRFNTALVIVNIVHKAYKHHLTLFLKRKLLCHYQQWIMGNLNQVVKNRNYGAAEGKRQRVSSKNRKSKQYF